MSRYAQISMLSAFAGISFMFVGASCPTPLEWKTEMIGQCSERVLTCRELCEGFRDRECPAPDEREECPAAAWGLNQKECVEHFEGVPLDVGCDDPLPYEDLDPDGYSAFACCCGFEDIAGN